MNRLLSMYVLFLSASAAIGQMRSAQPPCRFPGELLRKNGTVVRYESDEMKRRATHKADVSDFMKRVDIKGTTVVDVLVGVDGVVVCTKSLIGHPMIRKEVETALRSWTFAPVKRDGKALAYLGRLEFTLCNISCGEKGISMTLLG